MAAWTNEQAIPTVRVVQARARTRRAGSDSARQRRRLYTGSLFARASGYVTDWSKDIGAHVVKGEVLATISAPDLDQQLEEAKGQLVQLQAAVEQAQANADLGKVTDQRTAQLVAQGWTSKEQGDTDHLTSASLHGRARRRQGECASRSRPRSAGCEELTVSSRSRRRSTA